MGLPGLEARHEDLPLRHEAGQRRQAAQTQHRDAQREGGQRVAAGGAGQVVRGERIVRRPCEMCSAKSRQPAARKASPFISAWLSRWKNPPWAPSSSPKVTADADAQEHVADVAEAGEGQQALDLGLAQRHQVAHQHVEGAERQQDRAPAGE